MRLKLLNRIGICVCLVGGTSLNFFFVFFFVVNKIIFCSDGFTIACNYSCTGLCCLGFY